MVFSKKLVILTVASQFLIGSALPHGMTPSQSVTTKHMPEVGGFVDGLVAREPQGVANLAGMVLREEEEPVARGTEEDIHLREDEEPFAREPKFKIGGILKGIGKVASFFLREEGDPVARGMEVMEELYLREEEEPFAREPEGFGRHPKGVENIVDIALREDERSFAREVEDMMLDIN